MLAAFLAACVLIPWHGVAAAESEPEPRLLIPGGQPIAPGRVVELEWTAADAVRELEILLSTDGGRTYHACVSPELDPRLRRFRWRVPDLASADVRLRIRFNCGGREIEGPPTRARFADSAPDAPEPLGLPLASPDGRVPRPSDEPRAPMRGAGLDPGERTDAAGDLDGLRGAASGHRVPADGDRAPRRTTVAKAFDRVPRFVPMRT